MSFENQVFTFNSGSPVASAVRLAFYRSNHHVSNWLLRMTKPPLQHMAPKRKSPSCTGATNNKKGKQMTWDDEMDKKMISTLVDETIHGQKSRNGFSAASYHKVCIVINELMDRNISIEHVRARYRTYVTTYREARKVERNSGFNWDPTTERVTTADPLAWAELLEAKPELEKYRYKKVKYYDDLAIIVGEDEATGDGAETGLEADTIMPSIEEIGASHDSTSLPGGDEINEESVGANNADHHGISQRRKKRSRGDSVDELASAASRIATAMERPNMTKLQAELKKVPNISREVLLKAINHLGRDAEAAHIFMGLDDEFKMEWLQMILGSS